MPSIAFNRVTFLRKLHAVLGDTCEYRCWVRTLRGTTSELYTMWGETTIGLQQGIKQGSMEWAYQEAEKARRCAQDTEAFPELQLAGFPLWTMG